MKRETQPIAGRDAPAQNRTPPARPILILLGTTAALLLGVGYMLLNETPATPPLATTAPAQQAPAIADRSEHQLRSDLVRINQELEQARAEREAMLKAIEEKSRQLELQLREANLELGD